MTVSRWLAVRGYLLKRVRRLKLSVPELVKYIAQALDREPRSVRTTVVKSLGLEGSSEPLASTFLDLVSAMGGTIVIRWSDGKEDTIV